MTEQGKLFPREFPKKVYVKLEEDGGTEFLVCDEDPRELAEQKAIILGVYELVKEVEVERAVRMTDV